MWILSILPEWAFHTLLTVSVLTTIVGFVLGMIPAIKKYAIPIRIFGLLLLSLALYLEGGLADNKEWELKVKELEVKMAKLEAEAANKNVEIQEKIVEKTKVVHERGRDIIKYVDRDVIKNQEIVKYIENCPVPQEIVNLHNQAADLNKGDKK